MKSLLSLKTKCTPKLGAELVNRNSWVGLVVQSLCGHDAGRFYLVIGEDCERVYVVDGRYRSLENPKAKSWRHVVMIGEALTVTEVIELSTSRETIGEVNAVIRDEIYRVISNY